MLGPREEHFQMFARYNQWANGRLYEAAGQLTAEQLRDDRGAFFKSVLGALNHLVVTDRMWLGRIQGESPRGVRLDETLFEDIEGLKAARLALDQQIVDYVSLLDEERLGAALGYETTSGAPQSQPMHQVLAHLFNHQTHHRGQVHDLIGQIAGRDNAPVLDLLVYQRMSAALR